MFREIRTHERITDTSEPEAYKAIRGTITVEEAMRFMDEMFRRVQQGETVEVRFEPAAKDTEWDPDKRIVPANV